jgi:LysR family transcriptional regulator, transcriptional activator of the cysJI operon
MQIEALKVFCDLVEAESFSKAAEINQLSQPAVSEQINSLERHFKSRLIERSQSKYFYLTREGQAVDEYSKQILQSYDSLRRKVQEIRKIRLGTIRIATTYSIGLHELPPAITKFLKNNPEIDVHVEYRPANQVYEDVLGDIVDLGLVSYPGKNSNLKFVPLWKDKLVLICHPQNPLAKRRSIKLADIDGQKFIAFEPDIPIRKAIDKILKSHNVTVQNVMKCDNIETVKQAVEIDSGISIVPETTIVQERAKKTLVAVEFQDGEFLRPSAAIYKKNKVLSPAMKQLLAILKE